MRIENRPLSELEVGDAAEMVRLVTADDLYVFAAASGNHNPMHLPKQDHDGDGTLDEPVAPCMFVASLISAVLGMRLPGPGTLYHLQTLRFHDRAHAGDELVARVEVTAVGDDGRVSLATRVTRASDGALVLDGEAEVAAPRDKRVFEDVDMPGLVVQRHRHFEALLELARPLPPPVTGVVAPEEANSLGGAVKAAAESIIIPILIGDAPRSRRRRRRSAPTCRRSRSSPSPTTGPPPGPPATSLPPGARAR